MLNPQDKRTEKEFGLETQLSKCTVDYFLLKMKHLLARMVLSAGRQIHIHSLKPCHADDSPYRPACLLQHVPA